jgi:hypothetical protein
VRGDAVFAGGVAEGRNLDTLLTKQFAQHFTASHRYPAFR